MWPIHVPVERAELSAILSKSIVRLGWAARTSSSDSAATSETRDFIPSVNDQSAGLPQIGRSAIWHRILKDNLIAMGPSA
jgi:hypothetical protein